VALEQPTGSIARVSPPGATRRPSARSSGATGSTDDGTGNTAPTTEAVAYQSLYRRFRPQRFSEVLGQEFVTKALRNAVRDDRVGHAYLFSGPRGTGKTSSARILAKALNCESPQDGEPCGVCRSCREITAGSSLDVHELDAASNNGVDAMRDLVARAALGTPGRWKVYIVDEVHMLSAAASNALLKTLEEPPPHVVFVLATTDQQKVLPTIRSRTQHFEFRLLGPEVLHGLLETVSSSAGLDLPTQALEMAVRRGRGSARDALSVLDQVAAAGFTEPDTAYVHQLAEALATRDSHGALVAFASAMALGRDPLVVAGELADQLRQGFLSVVAPQLVTLDGEERSVVEDLASKMGLPAVVRAVEALGTVQVEMRESPDPRLHVEVCLLRLTRPETDDSLASVLERLERVERAVAEGASSSASEPRSGSPSAPGTATASAAPARGSRSSPGVVSTTPATSGGAAEARRSLSAIRRAREQAEQTGADEESVPQTAPSDKTPPSDAISGSDEASRTAPLSKERVPTAEVAFPTRDDLVQVWGDGLLASLPQRARARFRVGRFVEVDQNMVTFALPNDAHRSYCEEVVRDVEDAFATAFGVRLELRLVTDPDETGASRRPTGGGSSIQPPIGEPGPEDPGPGPDPDYDESELLDPRVLEAETEPAGAPLSPAERLKLTFPGAEEV